MKVNVLEDSKEKYKIEIVGESATLTQLVAKKISDADAAAFQEHPFMTEPKILVMGANPKKKVETAVKELTEECAEFKEEFSRAMKK